MRTALSVLAVGVVMVATTCEPSDDCPPLTTEVPPSTGTPTTSSTTTGTDPPTTASTAPSSTVPTTSSSAPSPSSTVETTIPDPTTTWTETFDTSDSLSRFDWFVHNAANFHERPTHWNGDHNDHCDAPTTVRDVFMPDKGTNPLTRLYDTIEIPETLDLVWWCREHVMTSFQTAGYGQVDFSPARTFVDVQRICWDQNQTNLGHRKWTQVVVVPQSVFDANSGGFDHRLDYVIPRLQSGPGSAGLKLTGGVYVFESVQGSAVVHVGQGQTNSNFTAIHKTNADKAARLTTCLDRVGGQTRVTQERLNGELVVRTLNGQFPAGPVRVIFQDDNYNPNKSCAQENDCPTVPDPLTWHFDNLAITTL